MPIIICIIVAPILFLLARMILRSIFHIYWTPFRFLKDILTNNFGDQNTYRVSRFKTEWMYPNLFQKIVFGYIGHAVYYLILAILFTIVVSYRPYAAGNIYKQTSYESGDVVVVQQREDNGDKIKTMGTILLADNETGNAQVQYEDGATEVAYYSFLNIPEDNSGQVSMLKGVYEEGDNFFFQLVKSLYGWGSFWINQAIKSM